MMASAEILDVIEHRIVALENLLIPNGLTKSKDDETIIDKLMQTHLMVVTALVQRETVIKILHRLPELNRLLDPSNSTDFDTDTMCQMLLTLYPALKLMAVDFKEYIDLRQYVDTKILDQIFELQGNLQKVYSNNSELYNECTKITQSIIKCLQDNFNIINSLSRVFAQLDCLVSSVEDLQNNQDIHEE